MYGEIFRYVDTHAAFASELSKKKVVVSIEDLLELTTNKTVQKYIDYFATSKFGECVEIEKYNLEVIMNFKHKVLETVKLCNLLMKNHTIDYQSLIFFLHTMQSWFKLSERLEVY